MLKQSKFCKNKVWSLGSRVCGHYDPGRCTHRFCGANVLKKQVARVANHRGPPHVRPRPNFPRQIPNLPHKPVQCARPDLPRPLLTSVCAHVLILGGRGEPHLELLGGWRWVVGEESVRLLERLVG